MQVVYDKIVINDCWSSPDINTATVSLAIHKIHSCIDRHV